ncbi:FtsX-like permease family protein [Vagococcus salmoninarum]|uniref:ABC3 transporter permease C-terminal domain-containing protein n=1 Tax=Vagococcus salmoninarum TaxID=2739 RepID=A0A429ZKA4_9ENTE|nr:FtsX-like permease family protein [Vagococcus salmoninarum]RST94140.1 hypothetical protein CBF35_10515 [Vagococcus salmoninarum]
MKKAQNTFASIRYYKKYNLLLFGFFSLSLMVLTLLRLLLKFQKSKMLLISERWDVLSQYLPGTPTKGFNTIVTANIELQETYFFVTKIAMSSILIIGIALTGTLLYHRRQDIKALLSLGLSLWRISFQLIIEALFPIIFSFLGVLLVMLLSQNFIKEETMSINEQLFSKELPFEIVIKSHNDLENTDQTNKKLLLPFNAEAFYSIETSESTFGSLQLTTEVARSFVQLFLLSLLFITLTSIASVFYLQKNMYA